MTVCPSAIPSNCKWKWKCEIKWLFPCPWWCIELLQTLVLCQHPLYLSAYNSVCMHGTGQSCHFLRNSSIQHIVHRRHQWNTIKTSFCWRGPFPFLIHLRITSHLHPSWFWQLRNERDFFPSAAYMCFHVNSFLCPKCYLFVCDVNLQHTPV